MFNKIKDFLAGETTLLQDSQGEPTPKDMQLATAVLLLEMAGADEDYAPEEVQACFRIMEDQFEITDMDSLNLMEEAQSLRDSAGKLDEFIEAVANNFDDKQKQLVLAMVWRVLMADNVIDNHEQKFASLLRQRLGVSREAAEEAKLMASRGEV